jgi:hypothetical protein
MVIGLVLLLLLTLRLAGQSGFVPAPRVSQYQRVTGLVVLLLLLLLVDQRDFVSVRRVSQCQTVRDSRVVQRQS